MPGIIKDVFSNIWGIIVDILISSFFIFAILIYLKIINIDDKLMFALTAVGYGIIFTLSGVKLAQRRQKERRTGAETEKTLVLNYGNIFITEIFALLAAIGILVIVYWSKEGLSAVNIVQSVFIFIIVKIVNWYYLRQQI